MKSSICQLRAELTILRGKPALMAAFMTTKPWSLDSFTTSPSTMPSSAASSGFRRTIGSGSYSFTYSQSHHCVWVWVRICSDRRWNG